MIQIANWVANLFILGLGVVLLAIGLLILLMTFFKFYEKVRDD
tara:strand:+ start:651 stop:779 length:129 start_codon:yes stop_codon:yes gene_type:complete